MAKILVTGGSGFIGTHLIRYLKESGHYVINADIHVPPWPIVRADEFRWADLREMDDALRVTTGVDWAFCLAADMGGMGFIGDPEQQAKILYNNTMINFNTLEAARANDVKRTFFSSSVCVYPTDRLAVEHPEPLKEEDAYPANPQMSYGQEKLYAEHLYQCYRQAYGIQTHIARFHNVYGPFGTWRGGREKAPAAFCRKIAVAKLTDNPEVEIWGDGRATRAFMWVGDCVEAIAQLIETGYGEPITLGPDRAISINELVDIIAGIAGVDVRKVYVNKGYQGVRGRAFDHARCNDVLGWVPDTPLEVGLEPTYQWIELQVKEALERGETV